ncbi:leucine--tRNA ligase [Mucilaginibacter rubeus]|uniref:Leucine--tRNA ligase n=1 Tax=Mucilaginibacter rubeus TaxID=2027860 RepID=A0AAE6JNX8_9SPHI|nr:MULTISPECIES: class I tRNA ligase family protein [Mucilaginibacter]QEM08010.1 leucine--tRNA ligase [Mucilaginibacter rubeus]QEM20461.1 leucine--tRNA ligase [Mucilaginibacter gossypii]QTE42816.1 leucine--tRNA ligase [Mucilaginibacter rubeus]QTE49417.1 leucine--tRNA ligase [Mucilaginibacter rubeus]QTE54513.1 leucine--tRNA ligase [Mucilaginibacter rubeus]
MDYQFKEIEQKWQQFWAQNQTFKAEDKSSKPKYYVLDMFPYPSGAGLHVGHPLGYIASDIFARYKRLKGFNVLHPMGYDSFGLPAEQYAIQTGQHPAITTEDNIATYRRQLDQIGFSFDWSREVRTSSPDYYKWTQWIFMQLFNSWYNKDADKAQSIDQLVAHFETKGSAGINAVCDDEILSFTADEWKAFSNQQQQDELLKYRLTYLRESTVNWCPALGTVLANDEVKDGFSERGGYPVEQKKMTQWSMRITAYAERLLQGLDTIDWPEPLKEMQRNWIGKSTGASVKFPIDKSGHNAALGTDFIEVFTTRVDTIFGVTFLVIAPEHELVSALTTPEQKAEIEAYITQTKKKSELDRMADAKTVSGAFTGSYVLNPLNGQPIPIWIADYVLAGYGTGAVMAVPSGDQRDYLFAKHFNLPIVPIIDIQNIETEADPTKEGTYINSDFINGLAYKEATAAVVAKLEEINAGKAKVNFRMRDAIFGRQRYWGEPVPVYFKEGLPHLINESHLPLLLPEIDKYLPTETGEPPLGRAEDWKYEGGLPYELSTMPGWAGSSWYWYRYMDAQNDKEFASREAIEYWKDVDLYIGGSEHATGHLLYSRFWNKFLKDLDLVVEEEPFKKLINQGMIQGRSNFVYRLIKSGKLISYNKLQQLKKYGGILKPNPDLSEELNIKAFQALGLEYDLDIINLWDENSVPTESGVRTTIQYQSTHVDVNIVENDILNIEKFKQWRPEFADAEFILEGGKYICGVEVEKMSKSKFNVVNPDDIISRFGADTLRMYEMFLGPLEQSKPWNTNGIEGVFKFLRKFWRLFHNDAWEFGVNNAAPSKAELKSLHKIIKKVEEDIERFSFNTSVSSFMIAVNELTDLKCNNRAILQDMVIILSPYAPHICEELWSLLGNADGTLSYAPFPKFNAEYLVEDEFAYPISINGKMKMNLSISLSLDVKEIEAFVLANADVQKYLDGKTPKKLIVVKGRIVNMVV